MQVTSHTFILIRSRNWIQQLAIEAPVLRNKSEGAEPRLSPTSNFVHSGETGMIRPTGSWPESLRPSSYGNDPRLRRLGSLWSKHLAKRREPCRPKCVTEALRLPRGLSSQFKGCKAVGADPRLSVKREVSFVKEKRKKKYKLLRITTSELKKVITFLRWAVEAIFSFSSAHPKLLSGSVGGTEVAGWTQLGWLALFSFFQGRGAIEVMFNSGRTSPA